MEPILGFKTLDVRTKSCSENTSTAGDALQVDWFGYTQGSHVSEAHVLIQNSASLDDLAVPNF